MGARGLKSAASLSVVAPQPGVVPTIIPTAPPAPAHISEDAAAWWRDVVRDYELESHHLRLLQSACEAWDRMQQGREAVAAHGITFQAANGDLKANPAVAIERDARVAFARIVRELDLDAEGPSDRSRPPALGSNRRGG